MLLIATFAMTTQLVDVADIRFTQEHIYDSFNNNCAKALGNAGGSTVAFIDQILNSEKTPRDLPLIRVAAKQGVYWCVDNRRLFIYKHCQLGKIPVQVFGWKENREFELKWKNGLPFRAKTGKGQRIGILQRTKVPFPTSPVMEPSLSEVHRFLDAAAQKRHDRRIADLVRRRGEEASSAQRQCRNATERALGNLLSASTKLRSGKRKKRNRSVSEDVVVGQASEADKVAAEAAPGCEEQVPSTAMKPKRKVKRRSLEADKASPQQTISHSSAGTTVTMTMNQDSDDDAFEVQLFAPP